MNENQSEALRNSFHTSAFIQLMQTNKEIKILSGPENNVVLFCFALNEIRMKRTKHYCCVFTIHKSAKLKRDEGKLYTTDQ